MLARIPAVFGTVFCFDARDLRRVYRGYSSHEKRDPPPPSGLPRTAKAPGVAEHRGPIALSRAPGGDGPALWRRSLPPASGGGNADGRCSPPPRLEYSGCATGFNFFNADGRKILKQRDSVRIATRKSLIPKQALTSCGRGPSGPQASGRSSAGRCGRSRPLRSPARPAAARAPWCRGSPA